jgi:hypothetical protein
MITCSLAASRANSELKSKRVGNHGMTFWVHTVIQMGCVYRVTDRVYCLMMENENVSEALDLKPKWRSWLLEKMLLIVALNA